MSCNDEHIAMVDAEFFDDFNIKVAGDKVNQRIARPRVASTIETPEQVADKSVRTFKSVEED